MKKGKIYIIEVPHLAYQIKYGINTTDPYWMEDRHVKMFAENTNRHTASIFFKKQPKMENVFIVAHEVMHCLQYMCRNRNIDMARESEHMAYLMQYILGHIMGYRKYDTSD